MTWAEFQIRLFAFNRHTESEMIKLRRLAWITYIAPHQDPKRLRGMSENKWWKIGGGNENVITEAHRQRGVEALKKYLKEKQEHGRA